MSRLILATFAVAMLFALPVRAFDIADYTRHVSPEVGAPLEATPGQRFYTDTWLKYGSSYEVAKPFESKMPGAGGFKFWFAIDATTLTLFKTSANQGLSYYVPSGGQFRAWHAMLGDVLAPGDTVGLVVNQAGGMWWFVDNTIHNSLNNPTIWSRPVNAKDPAITRFRTKDAKPFGAPIRQLDYLGVRDKNIAIRFTELSRDLPPRIDEFFFPIGADGVAQGVVLGAEFYVKVDPSQRAHIVVKTPMTDDYADKLPMLPVDEAPPAELPRQPTVGSAKT